VPIAYLLYVRRIPVLRVSKACEDSLPKAGRKTVKLLIDILIIFGIIGGTATALGLGIPMVSALLAEFLGVNDSNYIKFGMLALWAAIFSFSVYRGLKRGIKILADVNLVLAFIAITFIFIVGPTLFILKISVNSVGVFLNNFTNISLWTDPVGNSHFPEDWTVFYWTWYLAFTAFVGLFMFVLTAKILAGLPLGKLVLLLFLVLSTIFYATNVDSAAYVLSSISSKNLRGDQEPPRSNRLAWALLLALITAGLVVAGEITTIQSATIVSALPLVPIVILMCTSLLKWLKEDFGHIAEDKILTLPKKSIKDDA